MPQDGQGMPNINFIPQGISPPTHKSNIRAATITSIILFFIFIYFRTVKILLILYNFFYDYASIKMLICTKKTLFILKLLTITDSGSIMQVN